MLQAYRTLQLIDLLLLPNLRNIMKVYRSVRMIIYRLEWFIKNVLWSLIQDCWWLSYIKFLKDILRLGNLHFLLSIYLLLLNEGKLCLRVYYRVERFLSHLIIRHLNYTQIYIYPYRLLHKKGFIVNRERNEERRLIDWKYHI